MGQKVHPVIFRINKSNTKRHSSTWIAWKDDYAKFVKEDFDIRKFISIKLKKSFVANVEIDRVVNKIIVNIHTSRPGAIIGKGGEEIDKLKKEIAKLVSADEVAITITEIRKADLDASLVAQSIAQKLENRGSFKSAMKRSIQNVMRMGAKGVKIMISGRLNGAEIARSEWAKEGRIPLQTLRADIDYSVAEAATTYGVLGIKVWIYKGDIFKEQKEDAKPIPRNKEEL
ncbi:MAG: 30S ribosomal protein S3 [Alphaproteobacteria bacterium]|nr:30S ribosomal protein S3 [Alphaproteobacteria bacterium]MBL0718171.1 30S ribosomal protein S3 [Alphaproteobacteria bacterium]